MTLFGNMRFGLNKLGQNNFWGPARTKNTGSSVVINRVKDID